MSNIDYNVSDKIVPYSIPKKFKNGYPEYMFLAEAPGSDEEKEGVPLVGKAGQNFDKWLNAVGINRNDCIIANVFRYRPNNNKVDYFFCSPTTAIAQSVEVCRELPKFNSKLLIKHFLPEINHLKDTIIKYKPSIVVAMGNIPAWALLGVTKITTIQGNLAAATFKTSDGIKSYRANILPCFHPASTLYGPDKEEAIISCFKKAKDHVVNL